MADLPEARTSLEKYFIEDPLSRLFPQVRDYSFSNDPKGILRIKFSHKNPRTPSGRHHYHPTVISAHALSDYGLFAGTGRDEFKKSFLTYADWLVDNLVKRESFSAWEFDYPWQSPGYKGTPPWISSMAQGMAISVVVRARSLTGEARYASAALEALPAFEVPVSKGGLLRTDKHGCEWYEGIPSPIGAQILNEMVFALVGLHDMHLALDCAKARQLFDQGTATVKRHLADFDLDLWLFKWSRYDNGLLFYSGDKYHQIHLEQLRWLFEVTGDDSFAAHCRKWDYWQKRYTSPRKPSRKMIFYLVWSRLYIPLLRLTRCHDG